MAAQRRSRSPGRAAKDQEFEKLLRQAADFLQKRQKQSASHVYIKKRTPRSKSSALSSSNTNVNLNPA
jgi:hypothetical protein